MQSIDRNQQNSGSKTNYSRFSKAGFQLNQLVYRFLFPKWSAPNGNVQPQYAAQRSIVGCTVLGASIFIIRKPIKATGLPILDTPKGPFL
ncbi:MAG: hypothetical protein NXI00_22795, partial [Cytophagales bacterium]|nr:hypothetical protein [Cytophagales bacterium]